MKLILTKDVGGVGQSGEVKDVSDGYALNYLIPRGLAVQATAEAVAKHAAQAKKASEARARESVALAKAVESLEGKRVEIKARASEKGGLFKAITVADIIGALQTPIPTAAVQLDHPIKHLGEHQLKIRAEGAEANVTIVISAA